MVIQAPAKFYEEQCIPIVRWMYPGKAYKARLITVPRKYNQAIMFIYVIDDKRVVAFRNADMTGEIGILLLEHFEKIRELNVEGEPVYISVFPKTLTYDMASCSRTLLKQSKPLSKRLKLLHKVLKVLPKSRLLLRSHRQSHQCSTSSSHCSEK